MGLSYADLEGLWIQAGGSPTSAPIAAAIGLAESGGNPTSHNAKPPDDSYGIWQINMLGSMGPARRARYNLPSNTALFDPLTNARVAVSMSGGGTNFSPWSTFTGGAYRRYLQGNVPPNMTAGGAGGVMPAAATPAAPNLGDIVPNVEAYMFYSGAVIAGIVLLVAGVIVLTKDVSAGAAIGQVAAGNGPTYVRTQRVNDRSRNTYKPASTPPQKPREAPRQQVRKPVRAEARRPQKTTKVINSPSKRELEA